MSYTCYLDGVAMPVTPSKLTIKIKNKNKTIVLLDEGEVNFLRTPGLSELMVPLVFPMLAGKPPDYYLGILKNLKTEKKTTRFKLLRTSPSGKLLFDTDMKVSVEDYSIVEDAKDGLDVAVEVNLKEWRDYGTKTATVDEATRAVTIVKERDASTAPTASTHTVAKGETLWALAAKYYGSGAQYVRIYNANTNQISNPNKINVGQVLTIP